MDLSPEQIEQIATNVADKLKTQRHNRVISNEVHNEHHIFIAQFKEEVQLDKQAKRKIVESGKLWAFLLFLGFTATALWTYVLHVIEKGSGS